jgi:hypothetical protein
MIVRFSQASQISLLLVLNKLTFFENSYLSESCAGNRILTFLGLMDIASM